MISCAAWFRPIRLNIHRVTSLKAVATTAYVVVRCVPFLRYEYEYKYTLARRECANDCVPTA
jgi:hypothetical protein